jgi:hypothetical protein
MLQSAINNSNHHLSTIFQLENQVIGSIAKVIHSFKISHFPAVPKFGIYGCS